MTVAETFETTAPAAPGPRLEISLRPGVTFPDWPVVTSEPAAEALVAILEAFGVERRWSGLGDGEDRVRRAILEHYAKTGEAPSMAALSGATGIAPDMLGEIIGNLESRDMVVLDPGGSIAGAYPFTGRDSGHRVRLGGRLLNAMCAIDALGAGAMVRTDATIDSTCPACGGAIHVETKRNGAALAAFSPSTAVLWSGIQYANSCAAESLCTVIAFFCSDAHLKTWRNAKHPGGKGVRLSMDEGLQVGKAIFTPLLAPASLAA